MGICFIMLALFVFFQVIEEGFLLNTMRENYASSYEYITLVSS